MEGNVPNHVYVELNFPEFFTSKLGATSVLWEMGELSMEETGHHLREGVSPLFYCATQNFSNRCACKECRQRREMARPPTVSGMIYPMTRGKQWDARTHTTRLCERERSDHSVC